MHTHSVPLVGQSSFCTVLSLEEPCGVSSWETIGEVKNMEHTERCDRRVGSAFYAFRETLHVYAPAQLHFSYWKHELHHILCLVLRELVRKSVQILWLYSVKLKKCLKKPNSVWFNISLYENSHPKRHFTPSILVKNALLHCTNVFLKKSVGLGLQPNKRL